MPLVIHETTDNDLVFPINYGRGHDPDQVVPMMFAPPGDMELIPESEWDARIQEQEEQESSLTHLYRRSGMKHLDQGQSNYCWGHSLVHTAMLSRLSRNLPLVPLSAFGVCAPIKNGRNDGGWCGLSAQFARDRGIPSQTFWPQGDFDYRKYAARDDVWQNAALHKITEDYVDLTRPVWGQNLTVQQVATCLLLNIPVVLDFNWWGHSVCGIRWKKIENGSYGPEILNSWKGWGDNGLATLQGSRGRPDGALATRSTVPSNV